MIVNVNPCASTYDETLHAAKFSALASQVRSHTQLYYLWTSNFLFESGFPRVVLAVLELTQLNQAESHLPLPLECWELKAWATTQQDWRS